MNRLCRYLLSRAGEASTWRGVALLATAAGARISPEQQEAIMGAGLAIAGLIGAFFPDRPAAP
jgi:hypothetical protein